MSITVSPLRQTVSEGGVATFTATGSGIKTREFEYQWLKFSGNRSVVVGRSRQLMINNVRIEDGEYYYCSVTNQWNKIRYSETVTLTVIGKIQDYA